MFTLVFGRDSVCINVTSGTIVVGVDCVRLKYVLREKSAREFLGFATELFQCIGGIVCHVPRHLVDT